jgi:carbamoyl-phosphate synthase large subunit
MIVQTKALALGLNVVGLMNIQFAIKGEDIFILEVNPRASRTVPFVAKAINSPIAAIAARLMAGEKLSAFELKSPLPNHFAVKEAVMPFNRFPGVDPLLGPEMRSTGEVMGLDATFERAFLKSQLGAGTPLPASGMVFISIKDGDKGPLIIEAAQILHDLGFKLIATSGTAEFLANNGIITATVKKQFEGRPNIVDLLKDGQVDLIFNTTAGAQSLEDSRAIRSVALHGKIAYYTTAAASLAAAQAIRNMSEGEIEVKALQEY